MYLVVVVLSVSNVHVILKSWNVVVQDRCWFPSVLMTNFVFISFLFLDSISDLLSSASYKVYGFSSIMHE